MGRRSRSATCASNRPPSRDSTTSIQSIAPRLSRVEPLAQFTQSDYRLQMPAGQPQHADQFAMQLQNARASIPQPQYQANGLPITAEHHAQFQNQLQGNNSFYHQHSLSYNSQPNGLDYYNMPHQSTHPESHVAHATALDSEDTKKKGPATAQSNEHELRQSLEANIHRTLSDVAKEVTDSERTSRAEKTKQLFAMLWLNSSCETAKTSVPRSRVYSSYADRCGTERVQPLNPASFGKLVRIIFKGIQTRRLGVRGESKYHYVDLALKSEAGEGEDGFSRSLLGHEQNLQSRSPRSMALDFNSLPRFAAEASAIPIDEQSMASPVLPCQNDSSQADGYVFADPYSRSFRTNFSHRQSYPQRMSFPTPEDEVISEEIELPSMWPYAPEKTDDDAAQALVALYRSHCTSLVDYFKKCKEKQFYRMFTSFQGTLTVPVQKLLASPSMAAWIRESDWYMYQKMLAFIARIALQVLPPAVMTFFNTISMGLHAHITKTFAGLPQHVLEARLEPATLFCELINRMIKVNNAAHAASQVLELEEHREQLHREWTNYINPKRLMEGELPGCGYEETFKILTEDVAALLQPLRPPPVYEDELPYPNANMSTEGPDNYIDRMDVFLRGLPARFPGASARTIVSCVKNLSTAAMRDFTMQGAHSFHAWWIVKVFVDEYIQWLATSGGFLAHRPFKRGQSSPVLSHVPGISLHAGMETSAEGSRHQSRLGSLGPALHSMKGDSQTLDEMCMPTLLPFSTSDATLSRNADDSQLAAAAHPPRIRAAPKKRRSDQFDEDNGLPPLEMGASKKTRLGAEEETHEDLHFHHQHPSFGTTSFGSAVAPQGQHGVHKVISPDDIDDSGIGLGLLDEAGFHDHHNSEIHPSFHSAVSEVATHPSFLEGAFGRAIPPA